MAEWVWWIDGIKGDNDLARALRQLAENCPTESEASLLIQAADRIEKLSTHSL